MEKDKDSCLSPPCIPALEHIGSTRHGSHGEPFQSMVLGDGSAEVAMEGYTVNAPLSVSQAFKVLQGGMTSFCCTAINLAATHHVYGILQVVVQPPAPSIALPPDHVAIIVERRSVRERMPYCSA